MMVSGKYGTHPKCRNADDHRYPLHHNKKYDTKIGPEVTSKTFCDWIQNELEKELERPWFVEANGVKVPKKYGSVLDAG